MNSRMALSIGAGIAQGMEKASANLINIMKASYEIKQNRELLDLKKKAIEADTSQNAWERDYKLKEYDLQKKKIAVDEKTADIANYKTRQEMNILNKQRLGFFSYLSKLPKDENGNPVGGDGFPIAIDWKGMETRPIAAKTGSIQQQILGRMSRGEETDEDIKIYNEVIKKQPKNQSGTLFEEEGQPAAPAEKADTNNISLPDTITTTSQAVKHLQDQYGMDEKKAKDWIRQNIK